MKYLISCLGQHGIGKRALHEDDFWMIVEHEGIHVIRSDESLAFAFTMKGHKFIVLPRCHHGLRLLFTMFHELGHLLLMNGSDPQIAFQDIECDRHSRSEVEADAIALVALIPQHAIRDLEPEFKLTRYGSEVWRERCRLYFLYGI